MFDESVSTTKSLLPVSSCTRTVCGGVPIFSVTVQRKPSLFNVVPTDRLSCSIRDAGLPVTFWRGNETTAGLSRFSRTRASVSKKTRDATMAKERDGFMMFYEAMQQRRDGKVEGAPVSFDLSTLTYGVKSSRDMACSSHAA